MATSKEIKNRLKTLKSLEKVTDAMRKTAAARINRSKNLLFAFRPYLDELDELTSEIFTNCNCLINSPLVKPINETGNSCLVAITTDKGLCGSFNIDVYNSVTMYEIGSPVDTSLYGIGKKGLNFFRKKGFNVVKSYSDLPFEVTKDFSFSLADELIQIFKEGKVSCVDIIFTRLVNVVIQKPATKRLLPYRANEVHEKGYTYSFEPDISLMLDDLIKTHIRASLHGAMLESRASEQAARMVMMEKANKSSNEMIDELVILSNKIRQNRINRELADIIGASGFSA
jgi:F-type H+-transporting ATPase subunit gamma